MLILGAVIVSLVFLGFLASWSLPLSKKIWEKESGVAPGPEVSQEQAEHILRRDLTDTAELLQSIAALDYVENGAEWERPDDYMNTLIAENMPPLFEPGGGTRSVWYGVSLNPSIVWDPVSAMFRHKDTPNVFFSEYNSNEFVTLKKTTLSYKGVLISPSELRITATFYGTSRYGECSLTLRMVDGPPPPDTRYFGFGFAGHVADEDPTCRGPISGTDTVEK